MRQVFSSTRGIVVENVPAPALQRGQVLVQTAFSCISAGTELSGMARAETPQLRGLLTDPRRARSVLERLADEGPTAIRRRLHARNERLVPMGYSASGVVIAVAADVDDIATGTAVACAGAGYANHAEWLAVPRNLVVETRPETPLDRLAVTTIAAIALQGVRRAEPTIGEVFVVIGLGLIGQLTARLLDINGCRSLVLDTDEDRCQRALAGGASAVVRADAEGLLRVAQLTDGVGADGVIITASTASSDLLAVALRMCRKRGRVVVVGDVGMDIDRADMYEKELEVRLSTSYGPGRYERTYEEDGLDYPVGHVRWTENRNMGAVASLIADDRLRVDDLIDGRFPVARADEAYRRLTDATPRPLGVLLEYASTDKPSRESARTDARTRLSMRRMTRGRIRVGVIGAGSFTRAVHLPNLARLDADFEIVAIAAATGASAEQTARLYHARLATTDFQRILDDEQVDAVLVGTRHHLHASLAAEAIRAGKHVLVEKPLALTHPELELLASACSDDADHAVLLTGYNRRFSPLATALREWIAHQGTPVLTYEFNAGFLPSDHWAHGDQGGGRNIGEACHAYDLMRSLTRSPVHEAWIASARPSSGRYRHDDNFVSVLGFSDGSLASLTYTAIGGAAWKERITVHAGEATAELDDWTSLSFSNRARVVTKTPDKGHLDELKAFAGAIRTGEWPIPLDEQLEVAGVAIELDHGLRNPRTA